jgi:hypothetical protein
MAKKSVEMFGITRISNGDFGSQQRMFGETVEADVFVKQKLGDNYLAWLSLYDIFDKADDVVRKSTITEDIVESNKKLISLYSGLYGLAKANTKNADDTIAKSARNVITVFNDKEKIGNMSMNEQITTVYNFVRLFGGKFAADIEKIGAKSWVEQLEAENNNLALLYKNRNDEKAVNNTMNVKTARKNLTDKYRDLCVILNSFVLIEGEEKYADLIGKINAINEKFGTRKSSDKTDDMPIKTPSDENNNNDDVEETPEEQTPPNEPTPTEDAYPDAIEWVEGFGVANASNGMIFYVIVDGKKVFYKLVDRAGVGFIPGGTKYQECWEKLS